VSEVYKVGRIYIILFMRNSRYLPLTGLPFYDCFLTTDMDVFLDDLEFFLRVSQCM